MSKIYVSAMETHVAGRPVLDAQAADLLALLKRHGHDVCWNKAFRAYETIEEEITGSDALVAIVDSTWTSSTWMASEVTWANGDFGVTSRRPRKTIPVFMYPVVPRSEWGMFKNYTGPITLSRDPETAVAQVEEALYAGNGG